ncbi:MAG: nitrate reductase molybdenum cofactor assembly chaperone [Dysgonamonadaceae bacterium]|jgi:nitrate reductase delta subunit|nr:nitrate reductase molybdenum cofactor assembly chaperone [Dysgonamonadaceae bacterium]MDD3726983.1 nitrate reductase molybdenum cofactor assembly chaperone [Dysgonamonadaceae bacterium]MDD4245663.1 nitrate reductase molybdenum cofactor assembly chaperone [Dysgonamonadaceae bacterium]
MIKTYKILSLLLSYPSDELQKFLLQAEEELRDESLLHEEKIAEIAQFCKRFNQMDLTDWQGEYVQLFDYSRSVSLHIFEHIKGDSRDRGQAMVNLMEFYKEKGMHLTAKELPDYIPVFLEFLSTLSPSKSAELLGETVNIMDKINVALRESENPYSSIFKAIISLSAKQPDKAITREMIKNEKPLDLDAEYEEEPVTFGGSSSCSSQGSSACKSTHRLI